MAGSEKTWLDNNPPTCDAADLNGFKNENNNLISGSGQTIDDSDNQQTHKAVSHYAAGGDFYTDSGTANAKVLSVVGSKVAPPAYFNGMRVRFVVNTTNTGATTVNVASLGVKNVYIHTVALTGNELESGMIVTLVYDGTQFNIAQIQNPDYSDLRDSGGAANDKLVRALVDSGIWTLKSLNDALSDRLNLLRVDLGNGDGVLGSSTGGLPTDGNTFNADGFRIGGIKTINSGCKAGRTTDRNTSNAAWATISWDDEDWDTGAADTGTQFHDTTTNSSRITIPAGSGITKVRFTIQIAWESNGTGLRRFRMVINGVSSTGREPRHEGGADAGSSMVYQASGILEVTAGDYFEIETYQNSGGALNVLASYSFFQMEVIE